MSNDIHVHVHIHPDSSVLTAITQLKEMITMNFDEVTAALGDANTKLETSNSNLVAINTQFQKGINEVILAISQAGSSVPQAVVDAVNRLNTNVGTLTTNVASAAAESQQLDDLNPDTPPVP